VNHARILDWARIDFHELPKVQADVAPPIYIWANGFVVVVSHAVNDSELDLSTGFCLQGKDIVVLTADTEGRGFKPSES
jgi:hypothetical protein